jgi:hypothetical protein
MKGFKMLSKTFPALVAAVIISACGAHALELGIPFGFGNKTTFGAVDATDDWGSDVGLRVHISDIFALQPAASLYMRDSVLNVGLNIDALFYIFESNDIRQYMGVNVGANVAHDNNDNIRLGGIYGLQHPLTSAVDLFGQMGLGVRFKPDRVYTVNTQLGVIFYVIR